MTFVDGDGSVRAVVKLAGCHPVAVLPLILIDVPNDGGSVRASFGSKTDWVSFLDCLIERSFDFVFVEGVLAEFRDE